MKDFMTITIGDFGCTTETEVTVKYGDRGLRRFAIGELIDYWIKDHPHPLLDGDPATQLVGRNAAKHLKAFNKQHGRRQKDHS